MKYMCHSCAIGEHECDLIYGGMCDCPKCYPNRHDDADPAGTPIPMKEAA